MEDLTKNQPYFDPQTYMNLICFMSTLEDETEENMKDSAMLVMDESSAYLVHYSLMTLKQILNN